MRWLFRCILIGAILTLAAAAQACSNSGKDHAGAPPTSAVRESPAPAPSPHPTASATFAPATEIPRPIPHWITVDPRDATPYGQDFLLDMDTVTVLGISSEPRMSGADPGTTFLGFSPAGEAAFGVFTLAEQTPGPPADIYVGFPNQELRHLITLPARPLGHAWSPDGALLALGNQVVDVTTGKVIFDLQRPEYGVDAWSSDGKYLAVFSDSPSYPQPRIVIWNRATRESRLLDGFNAAWAHGSAQLVYETPGQLQTGPSFVHIVDARTGTDRLALTVDGPSHGLVHWSADDRFLAAEFVVNRGGVYTWDTYVTDAAAQAPTVTVHGAWTAGWLDAGTLFFVGGICADWDIYTVRVDGSDLRNHTSSPGVDLNPTASPDGKHLVFRTDTGVRLLDVGSDLARDLVSGMDITDRGQWSADGRCLAVGVPGAHGLCEQGPPQVTSVEVAS